MQVTGSFKVRGALFAIDRLAARGVRSIVAASAGNHGAGVAFAARALGLAAIVVVPKGAARPKVDLILRAGATVIEEGDGYDAAEAHARGLARDRSLAFVSPYDDTDVIAGNGGALGNEIATMLRAALGGDGASALVLAPFGGGGLASGLACALAREGPPYGTRRVWGVQSEASPSFALSLERGAAVTAYQGDATLADGLEGGISERAFARAAGALAGVVVMAEEDIAAAMAFGYRELGLVLEGSAAVALAPLLGTESSLRDCSPTSEEPSDVVIVLSGRNVDPEILAATAFGTSPTSRQKHGAVLGRER